MRDNDIGEPFYTTFLNTFYMTDSSMILCASNVEFKTCEVFRLIFTTAQKAARDGPSKMTFSILS
ncbi:hypothetical protein E2C01_001615 [Portunus trituberculatus]|uniref:Uncharacterized protein n=1 Tax=Portunus trituberculatus TaxID=210409 RepID=A0A5B7CJV7_PORTR|nr:hypothetical protein [Portunus trituberculatus]